MKKRILVLLLALVMTLSLLPFGASAADVVANGKCGVDVRWSLDSDGVLTISGTWQMEDYTYDESWGYNTPFSSYAEQIRSIVIEPGVTHIGDYAFPVCSAAESVTIPDTVTSIGHNAFGGSLCNCEALKTVNLPDSVTSIGDYAFGSTGLTSVTIPKGVTTIGAGAFGNCKGLTAINVAKENTSFVSVDRVLLNADQTDILCFPAGKTGSYAIPDTVTSIPASTFSGCKGLTAVTIPGSVTTIGAGAFYNCESLTKVEIPFGVTSIESNAFSGCKNLASLSIPNSVKSIGSWALSSCYALEKLVIPEGVESLGSFLCFDTYALKSITIPSTMKTIGARAFPYGDEGEIADLADVYYNGQPADWAQIEIAGGNEALTDHAQIHFHSHTWGDWKVTTPATETAEGVETRTCSECGATDMRAIEKLAPSSSTNVNNPFVDVEKEEYYFEPVLWAVSHDPQITNGMDETHFEPNTICNRAQVVTFLWRAKGEPTPKTQANPYKDVSKTDYFYDAVLWAMENGITVGTSDDTFSPKDPCTRAHVVTFLWRAEGKPEATGKIPFEDIPAEEYFTDAVSWAVNHNPQITNGMDETHFEPNTACTRGQVVTFLYRDMGK